MGARLKDRQVSILGPPVGVRGASDPDTGIRACFVAGESGGIH